MFPVMREEICHIVVNCESSKIAQGRKGRIRLRELWIEAVVHFSL